MAEPTQHRVSKTISKTSTTKSLTAGQSTMRCPLRSPAHTRRGRLIVFGLALLAILYGEVLILYGYTGLGRMTFLLAMCVLLVDAAGDVKGALGEQRSTDVDLELRTRAVVAVVVLEVGCFVLVLAQLLRSYEGVYGEGVMFLRGFGTGYMAVGCVLAVRVRRAKYGGGEVKGL